MGNRKAFLNEFIDTFKAIILNPDVLKVNVDLLTNLINGFTDAEMDKFVDDIEAGHIVVPLIAPDGSGAISYENNLKVVEGRSIKMFKRIKTTTNGESVMSSIPWMVAEVTGRKPIQLLDKKRSVPLDDRSRSTITGQVTNASKSMSITAPEISLMLANGMYKSIIELTRYRGGDEKASLVMKAMASHGIDINQETLAKYSNGPEVNNALKQFLLAMQLDSNIGEMK